MPLIQVASNGAGIPPEVLTAVVRQESGFNPDARSPVGAIGYAQLMPETAKSLGVNPNNAMQNLMGGARYLRQMYDKYKSWPLAFAAYNAGPGAVDKYGGIPPFPETQSYVNSIIHGLGW